MAKWKIIFRADGNSEIGLGHIMRSLALADMLKNDFVCEFATRFVNKFIISEIEKVCSKTYKLPEDEKTHFDYFLKLLRGDEVIVLDNYYFSTNYQIKIKEKGCNLVCIDDMADRHFVSDLVINHAPAIRSSDYSCKKKTRLLLGLDYVLLREQFLSNNKIENKDSSKIKLFLSFGGSDSYNLTYYYLELLINIEKIYEIHVLVSSSNRNSNSLKTLINLNPHKNVFLYMDIEAISIAGILDKTNIAICPASTISYEALAKNNKLITGYNADNQMNVYKGLNNYDSVIGLGDLRIPNQFNLESVILSMDILVDCTANIIDGKSAFRIQNSFKELVDA